MRLVGDLPDHYFLVSGDLVILDVSDSVFRDSCVTRDEVIGKIFHPLSHNSAGESCQARLRQFLTSGLARDIEICCMWNDTERTFTFCGARVSGSDENGAGLYLLVGRDVSDLAERAERREYQALHDPLTGVLNRWYLDELLRREEHRGRRHTHPISFLMIDVDHLKLINDTHGHLAGDEVLKWVSQKLHATVRESDYVVRFGGDEFLVVMPENNGEVEAVQHRITSAIATSSDDELRMPTPVTVSIGAASWFPNGPFSISDVIKKADSAMYESRSLR